MSSLLTDKFPEFSLCSPKARLVFQPSHYFFHTDVSRLCEIALGPSVSISRCWYIAILPCWMRRTPIRLAATLGNEALVSSLSDTSKKWDGSLYDLLTPLELILSLGVLNWPLLNNIYNLYFYNLVRIPSDFLFSCLLITSFIPFK